MERKIDGKRRGLEDLILSLTMERQTLNSTFKFSEADRIGKALEFLAVSNHNLWMSTIALGGK